MKGARLARRAALLGQRRLVLFEDRVEEHFLSVFGLEVRRLFFDELECATLRPQRQALEIVGAALGVALGLLVTVIGLASSSRPAGGVGLALALACGTVLLLVLLWPPWQLVLRAGTEECRSLLPRRGRARQQALLRLGQAVRVYQRRHAPPEVAQPDPTALAGGQDTTASG
jgi:hypothetical protein